MLPQRFWDKVNKTDTCWYWTGAITRFGYPRYRTGQEVTTAYRAMYIDTYGSPPPGLEIDHLCHTRDIACLSARECMHRRCVNPDHLEAVSGVENLKRAHREMPTRCKNGHVRTSENTVVRPRGTKPPARECLICRRDSLARRKEAKRACQSS